MSADGNDHRAIVAAVEAAEKALRSKSIDLARVAGLDCPATGSRTSRTSLTPSAPELLDVMIALEAEKFRNYWVARSGAGAIKRDWSATWRNWILNAMERRYDPGHSRAPGTHPVMDVEGRSGRRPCRHGSPISARSETNHSKTRRQRSGGTSQHSRRARCFRVITATRSRPTSWSCRAYAGRRRWKIQRSSRPYCRNSPRCSLRYRLRCKTRSVRRREARPRHRTTSPIGRQQPRSGDGAAAIALISPQRGSGSISSSVRRQPI